MKVLAIRTDKPQAELYLYEGDKKLAEIRWQAHRQLAETIHKQIAKILNKLSNSLSDVEGIIIFKGPGSFTGLRIGASVANALAYSLDVPIVATAGENWLEVGIRQLQEGKDQKIAVPDYGSEPHTTTPRG